MAGRKKALGYYERLDEEGKKIYDQIIEKSFKTCFPKLTKREVDYLCKLYEEKMNEIVESDRPLDKKDAVTLAITIKLKAYTASEDYLLRRSISRPLSKAQKQDARNKLGRMLKYASK